MQSISNDNFGPLVAYLLPGATALLGLRPYSPVLQNWFAALPPDAPTIGGFLYLTLASLAAGMTVSAVRWALVDKIHEVSGLKAPTLDFAALHGRVDAMTLLIEIHYRHYQFYANMFVATAVAYVGHRAFAGFGQVGWIDAGVIVIECIFFMTSRDTLRKYYSRSQQLMSKSK
jgi:hypothetical protein